MAEGVGSPVTAAGSQLQAQLSRFPSADLLERPITESHLGKLVHCLNLETVLIMAAELGLTDVQVDDVKLSYPGEPLLQRLEMLKRSQTTYRCVHCDSLFAVHGYSILLKYVFTKAEYYNYVKYINNFAQALVVNLHALVTFYPTHIRKG